MDDLVRCGTTLYLDQEKSVAVVKVQGSVSDPTVRLAKIFA